MVQSTPVLLSPFKHFTSCSAWNMSSPVVISSQSRNVGSDNSSVATDTRLLSPPVARVLVTGKRLGDTKCVKIAFGIVKFSKI